MKKKLFIISVGVIFSMSINAAIANGLTLQSNAGTLTMSCNGTNGVKPISRTPQLLSWSEIAFRWGNTLNCKFLRKNNQRIVTTAILNISQTAGEITAVTPCNGYPMPTIVPGQSIYTARLSVTFNPIKTTKHISTRTDK